MGPGGVLEIQYESQNLFFNLNSSRPKHRVINAIGVINKKKIIPKIKGLIIFPRISPNLNQKKFSVVNKSGEIIVIPSKIKDKKRQKIAITIKSLKNSNNERNKNIKKKKKPKVVFEGNFISGLFSIKI